MTPHEDIRPAITRRGAMAAMGASALCALSGCVAGQAGEGEVDLVWGRRGRLPGFLEKPRAMAINRRDELFIVDMTARIQVFTAEGEYLRGWQTPEQQNGRPSGLTVSLDGNLLVADTHYYRMLVYTPEGQMLPERTIGGTQGNGPGEFSFVTDCVQDSRGNYYIGEYGEYDRIQKFTPSGEFVLQWGGHGPAPGQFVRPQNFIIDERDRIWVADACNHRIQVFDTEGKLLTMWGSQGSEPGQLSYPYDLDFGPEGDLYIVEYGNHRVQKFDREGKSLACWGTHGRGPGQTHNPWSLCLDSQGRVHVLDTNNHRVQRIWL